MEHGRWALPSQYSADPYTFTRLLIEDGRKHLLLDGLIRTYAPTVIMQGAKDPDVPLEHTLRVVHAIAKIR